MIPDVDADDDGLKVLEKGGRLKVLGKGACSRYTPSPRGRGSIPLKEKLKKRTQTGNLGCCAPGAPSDAPYDILPHVLCPL